MGCAHKVDSVTYSKSNGQVLSKASLNDEVFGGNPFIALKRENLIEKLAKRLNGEILFSTTIQSFVEHGTTVEVLLTSSKVSDEFDLIVSAEGLSSSLRRQCFSYEETIRDHCITNWRFISRKPNHGYQPTYMFGRSDLFMIYPISPDELYCYGHVYDPKCLYYSNGNATNHVKRLYGDYGNDVPTLVRGLHESDIVKGRLKSVIRPYMSKGRIVFIGDAANACSPLLQQGAAGAFEDALCLVDELKAGRIDQAIDNYHVKRDVKNRWVLEASDVPVSKVKASRSVLGSFVRNAMIKKSGPLNVQGWKRLASTQ